MTLEQACKKAQEQSREDGGCVQHVEKLDPQRADARYRGVDVQPEADYIVSDWYDGDATVRSYENGREL